MAEILQHFTTAESEGGSRLRALLANHALGIIEVTAEGVITMASRTLCDWIGIEPHLVLGRALASLMNAEDQVTLARQFTRLVDGTIDGTTVTHRLHRGAGVELWVRSTWSVRRGEGGAVTHMIAIVDNIIQQREDELVRSILEESIRRLEERRRTIDTMLGSLPAITWRALPSGICEYLSPQWCTVTGMRDGTGLRWLGAIHPEDRRRFAAAWSQTSPYSDEPTRLGCRLRDADGDWHRYEAIGAPIRGEDGEIIAWTGVLVAAPAPSLARIHGRRADDAPKAGELPLRALLDRRPEPTGRNGFRPV